MNSRHVVVMTTTGTKAEAHRLAVTIVDAQLAACVQFWPIHSVYRWKGKRSSSREYLLLCKTRAGAAKPLQTLIRARHTYELPEIAVLPITTGLPDYLDWINKETGCRPGKPLSQPAPALTFSRQGTKSSRSGKRGKS